MGLRAQGLLAHPLWQILMFRASIFESAGLHATCSLCGNAIRCGVLHSGSCNQNPKCGELEDEDIDPRAERPLMFENHELVSGTPIAADHAMLTFLHRCHAPGGPTALISRDWEKHMLPYANAPGKDVGITDDDYAWLLRQCKAGLPSATEPYHSPGAGMSCSYQ